MDAAAALDAAAAAFVAVGLPNATVIVADGLPDLSLWHPTFDIRGFRATLPFRAFGATFRATRPFRATLPIRAFGATCRDTLPCRGTLHCCSFRAFRIAKKHAISENGHEPHPTVVVQFPAYVRERQRRKQATRSPPPPPRVACLQFGSQGCTALQAPLLVPCLLENQPA